jgi:ABC-type nickel/cobalt efflux system permease component RcnA
MHPLSHALRTIGWTLYAMLLSPRRASTCADLLRLLAMWMAAVLLAQGCAAATARGEGPRHVHRAAAAYDLWAHAHHHHHHHHHDGAERHHHVVNDASVLASPGDAMNDADAAALALAAAFALLALPAGRAASSVDGRVWHTAPGWALNAASLARLTKPPRHG